MPESLTSPATLARSSSKRLAVIALIGACAAWGLSFPLTQIAAVAIDRGVASSAAMVSSPRFALATRGAFHGYRFLLAALVFMAIARPRLGRTTRNEWLGALWIGLFTGAGMFCQIAGLNYTRPSVSGFLTAMTVIFAPLGQAMILRRKVHGRTWLAVAIALAGLVTLAWSVPASTTHTASPPIPYLGEALTVFAALFFTGQILSLDRYGSGADSTRLTPLVFMVMAIANFVAAIAAGGTLAFRQDFILAVVWGRLMLWAMPVLVLVCTILAFHLMNAWQPLVSPAAAAVIYCTEPLFATVFSLIFGTESLVAATVIGGGLILIAVLIVSAFTNPPKMPIK